MGVDEAPLTEVLTGTEIRSIFDTSAEHGHLGEEQALMIKNSFRFDERSVGRVMVPRVDCKVINLDDPLPKNIAVMKETQHSRFPVVENKPEHLVGIVLTKELMDAVLGGEKQPWAKIKSYCREPLIVPESIKVARMFDVMREDKRHMACIVDEYGVFVGVVTMEDLLEEIVGEISDETDDDLPHALIERVDEGWHASGLMSLADAERETGFHVSDTFEANTLSGLFMTRLERMPQIGDCIYLEATTG
jgi:CBS domain containing-hemolysin-like protein